MSPEPRTPLEQILFLARTGASRADVRAWWPPDTEWTENDRELTCPTGGTEPFTSITYVFMAEKLYNMRLRVAVTGAYDVFERLERQVRDQLPSIASWTETSTPWSTENARARLEGKGSDRFKAGVRIGGDVPGGGELSGSAVAFRSNDRQGYGFELFWFATPATTSQ